MKKLLCTVVALGAVALATPLMALETAKSHGEFGDHCAMGLTMGKEFKTDCSVNWTDSKSGKTYCFGNEEVKKQFSQNAEANVAKAAANYSRMHHEDGHAASGHTGQDHGKM